MRQSKRGRAGCGVVWWGGVGGSEGVRGDSDAPPDALPRGRSSRQKGPSSPPTLSIDRARPRKSLRETEGYSANFPGNTPVPGHTAQDHEKIWAREAILGRFTAACFSLPDVPRFPDIPRLLRLRNFSIRAGGISRKFDPGGGRLGQGRGHPQGLG